MKKKIGGWVMIVLGIGIWISMYWVYPKVNMLESRGFFWFLNALFGSFGAIVLMLSGAFKLNE